MGISEYIQRAKAKVREEAQLTGQGIREYKVHKRYERDHPDEVLKQLREEKKLRGQREEVRKLKAEARGEKFKAVAQFFGGPTVAAAKKSRKAPVNVRGYESQPNPAFGLGASKDSYNLDRPNVFGRSGDNRNGVFGLGGSKPNPAFGLGRERKPSVKKARQR